jgi:CBS domain-containing protein
VSTNASVGEAMSSNPRSVDPDMPVVEVARIMLAEDIGSLPVVQGERLIGVITDRDIALRVVAEGKDPTDLPVAGIASREIVTVAPEQSLDEALQVMASAQVRRLPVVDDGHLVGILAQADVARSANEQATGWVVEEISQPRAQQPG